MSRQHEVNRNNGLAQLLNRMFSSSQVRPENSDIIADHSSKHLNILITATGRAPVIIEAEYSPAINVEQEARDRLGCRIRQQTHPVEAVIALCYPNRIATVDDIDKAFEDPQLKLQYCAVYPKGKRFPTTGWLTGSVSDLADLIHLVDVPETAFDKAAEDLENSIDEAVSVLGKESVYPLTDKIFNTLQLSEDPAAKNLPEEERLKLKNRQTRRIAGAMIANAFL